jgi:hypothetical protein
MSEAPHRQLRRIFRSAGGRSAALREVLQLAFLAELAAPGQTVWVAVPRIGDAVILDNRGGGFDVIDPEWGRREVRLADLLAALLVRSTQVHIVAPSNQRNGPFLRRMSEAAAAAGTADLLTLSDMPPLHARGILMTRGVLLGSLDLTEDGIEPNDDVVEFDASSSGVAAAHRAFSAYRGVTL